MAHQLQDQPLQVIRDAQVADLFAISTYGETFWKQTPYGDKIPYDRPATLNLLTCMVKDHYLYVAVHGTTITGFLGLLETPLPFNPEYDVATEMFFYVREDYRGQGISKELYAYAESDIQTDPPRKRRWQRRTWENAR